MKYSITAIMSICLLVAGLIFFGSCTKGGSGGITPPPPNTCAGITIVVNGVSTDPSLPGTSTGSISATASGSTGITFSINGGDFQASGNFTNLAAGVYAVSAKNGIGCSGSNSFTLTDPNSCTGITITVNNSTTAHIPCQANNGRITVAGTGGTPPFTYSLNGGIFQSSDLFSNLNAGNYTITAKDANGCTGTGNATVSTSAAGVFFSAVRTVVQTNCIGCHDAFTTAGGINFTIDCNIVINKDRIQSRTNDVASPMPPAGMLPASERQKITDWINAGGQFNN